MAKMKYWDGTKWVVLDAADADTVEGKTVAQIRSDRASKAEFDAHRADNMPHQIQDLENNKIYRYGLQMKDGKPQIIYEEVV